MMKSLSQHARAQFCFVILRDAAERSLSTGIWFWAAWLVLVALEVTLGSNAMIGITYFTTILMLVGFLTWANRRTLFLVEGRLLALGLLGASVLLAASVIIGVGIAATASLKALLGT